MEQKIKARKWFLSPDVKIMGDDMQKSFVTKKEADAFLAGMQFAGLYFADISKEQVGDEFKDHRIVSNHEYFGN
jgi:hypothetical protein